MVKIENACVNCPPEICRGATCKSKLHYCDLCEEFCDPSSMDPRKWLYDYDGTELYWSCVMDAAGITVVE